MTAHHTTARVHLHIINTTFSAHPWCIHGILTVLTPTHLREADADARTKVARERHGTRLYSVRRRSSMTDGGLESKSLFELSVWKKQPSASDQPIQANDSELETFALLESLEALIFPSSFQYQCSTNEGGADGDETRELFGTLVPLMKVRVQRAIPPAELATARQRRVVSSEAAGKSERRLCCKPPPHVRFAHLLRCARIIPSAHHS